MSPNSTKEGVIYVRFSATFIFAASPTVCTRRVYVPILFPMRDLDSQFRRAPVRHGHHRRRCVRRLDDFRCGIRAHFRIFIPWRRIRRSVAPQEDDSLVRAVKCHIDFYRISYAHDRIVDGGICRNGMLFHFIAICPTIRHEAVQISRKRCRSSPVHVPVDKAAGSGSVLREMADGIRYVISARILRWLSLCFMLVGLGVGLISPLSIFLVTERLGLTAQHLQWITIPYGAGEIIGGIIAFRLAARVSPKLFLMIGLLVNGAGIVVSGLSAELWLTMAAHCLIALFQPAIFIGNHTLVMQHTEQAYIGRVTGIRTPLMTGAMLLAMSFAGVLKHVFSLVVIYDLAAFCFVAGFLVTLPAFSANKSAPAAPSSAK